MRERGALKVVIVLLLLLLLLWLPLQLLIVQALSLFPGKLTSVQRCLRRSIAPPSSSTLQIAVQDKRCCHAEIRMYCTILPSVQAIVKHTQGVE